MVITIADSVLNKIQYCIFFNWITWVSQKFCNILVVHASLQHIYHVTKAIQAMERYLLWGW